MKPRHERRLLVVAYGVSGACALVFQVVWSHALVDQLGASSTTVLLVLGTFIGALGLGSALSPAAYRWAARRFGGHGLRNYGRTELLLTATTLALVGLTRLPLERLLGSFPYRERVVGGLTLYVPTLLYQTTKLGLAVATVGLPCFLMGLTFPYLCALHSREEGFPSRLYAANTLGACASVLVTEFWGLGALGYMGCLSLGALGTASLGVLFLSWPDPPDRSVPEPAPAAARAFEPSVLPGVLSGFLCGGLQALGLAYVRLELGPTRGAFALLSFFAILGIWLASALVHRWKPSRRTLLALAWGGLLWLLVLWSLEPGISGWVLRAGAGASALSPYVAALLAVSAAAGLFLFLPYAAWSTLLPSLCDRLQGRGLPLSRAYSLNTISFLAGVLVFGWALPGIHVFLAARVFAVVGAVGLLLLTLSPWERQVSGRRIALASVAAGLSLAVVPRDVPQRLLRDLADGRGNRMLAYRGSAQSFFWVRRNPDGSRVLMFDGHSMSGTVSESQTYMRAMAHVPLLLHPRPERALLICFGVGATADAIRKHGSLSRLDVVDLNPGVFLLNRYFEEANGHVLLDPRVRLVCDDGRQFVKLSRETYDFVTMEPPPPLQPGISRLYSAEYYEAVKSRLAPGGVVSQWLPEFLMDEAAVDLVNATFVQAFRHTLLFVGWGRNLILVGSDSPLDIGRLAGRLAQEPVVGADLARFGFTSPARLLAAILKLSPGMRRRWGTGLPIQDGFTSLEAIQVNSPVQQMHARSAFQPPKRSLVVDPGAVPAALRASDPSLAEEVAALQADPRRDRDFAAILPPFYLGR